MSDLTQSPAVPPDTHLKSDQALADRPVAGASLKAPAALPPAIRFDAISKVFKAPSGAVAALDSVSLDVAPGEIFGIIGKSGAGKSTLIRCANLLERPTSGRVYLDGQDLTALGAAELRAARRRIGMIFQSFNLLSSRTVFDNVALPLELAGTPRSEIAPAVRPLLDLVGLSDKADVYPAKLSGGQKQRVGIARALAGKPKVLLSDEATSALDPQTTEQILTLLKDINQRLGLTIVLITHEMSVIKEICDKVAVLDGGRIVEQGPVAQVFSRPQTRIAQEFVAPLFNRDLPPALAARLSPEPGPGRKPLLRIGFHGRSARNPVLSDLIVKFHIQPNVLHGHIDHIGEEGFGTLVISLDETAERLAEIAAYLVSLNLEADVLGYVAYDA